MTDRRSLHGWFSAKATLFSRVFGTAFKYLSSGCLDCGVDFCIRSCLKFIIYFYSLVHIISLICYNPCKSLFLRVNISNAREY